MSDKETEEPTFEDPELHRSSSKFIESVITRLNKFGGLSEEESPPGGLLDLNQFGVDYETNEINEPMNLAKSLVSMWSEFDNYSDCVAKFRASDLYLNRELKLAEKAGIIDEDEYEEYILNKTLPDLLGKYLEENGSLEFNQVVYKNIYSEFEEYLKMNDINYVSSAPLYGFDMERESLELSDDMKIKKVKKSDVRRIFGVPPSIISTRHDHEISNFVIQKEHSVDRFDDSPEPAEEEFDRAILALRLYDSEGDVAYSSVESRSTSPFHDENNRSTTDISVGVTGKTYELTEEECGEFLDFWETISEQMSDPEEAYRIALDKFSNAFHREKRNDRLLDCVITLEALYLKGGEEGEMSYRLSQRGALLLSDSPDRAEEIQDTLKSAYSARSNIVHGGKVTSAASKSEIIEILDLTRKSLSEFLKRSDKGKDREDILETLDKIAITPSS
jgi:uncharacterized protein YozE (UPF0346 family)